ncbi:MAG: complex I subunit 4 family protein [Nitrososphaerales archaeon]
MDAAFLLQAVIIPILASPIAFMIGRKYGSKATMVFAFVVLMYSTFALLLASSTSNPYSENYLWFPQALTGSPLFTSIGNFGLYADGISIPLALTIYIVATATSLYSIPYMKQRISGQKGERKVTDASSEASVGLPAGNSMQIVQKLEVSSEAESERTRSRFGLYSSLFLLFSAGMVGCVLSTNLIELYFFFEFMLLPSYFLIAEFGYGARGRISVMYLLWTHIGALLMLLSFLAIGTQTNNFVFLGSGAMTDVHIAASLLPWIVFGLVIGLFVKLAAFGLHVWLPQAYSESPAPISVLLSSAMVGIGAYILIRLFTLILPRAYDEISLGIATWGVITIFYGGIMALAQDDLKHLLAYSSISQIGYIIFGFATASTLGVGGTVFQFVSNGTSKAILFMAAGLIMTQAGGLRSIRGMGGLSLKLPVTALCVAIGFLGLIGFPETNGFQSEWLIFAGGLKLGAQGGPLGPYWLVLSVLVVIGTILTATYALWTMKRVFFGALPSSLAEVKEGSIYMLAPMIFLALLTILLGVLPGIVDTPLFHTLTNLPNPLR